MEALDPLHLGILTITLLSLAGFLAGFIDSVAGGGGLISLPATLIAGLPPQTALGTGKFMAAIGTTMSVATYARNGAVAWRIALAGVVFSFVGSAIGAKTALYIDNSMLGKIILCLLPLAAAATFLPLRKSCDTEKQSALKLYLLTPILCSAIGFYDGFFGPGTGSFMLLALHFFLGLGLIKASGTTKVFNLASNISGLIIFLIHGKVYFIVAVPMAIGNMIGNYLGCRMALRGGPGVVRRMLFLSLGLLFASLVWRYVVQE